MFELCTRCLMCTIRFTSRSISAHFEPTLCFSPFGSNLVMTLSSDFISTLLRCQHKHNKAMVDIIFRPMFGAGGSFLLKQQSLLRVAYCWPLCVNMTASIKPEIHNIATLPEEDRTIAIGNMPKNLVKIGCAVPEICSWSDKQRNTQTWSSQHSAHLWRRSNCSLKWLIASTAMTSA